MKKKGDKKDQKEEPDQRISGPGYLSSVIDVCFVNHRRAKQ